MTRTVRWTRPALDDLKAQITYIAAENPVAARNVRDRLHATAEALGEIATGRPGRVGGTYEKSVSRLPYIISYEFGSEGGNEVLWILRIVHTARDWPPESWP